VDLWKLTNVMLELNMEHKKLSNLAGHFIPQARMRHQMVAIKAIQKYQKSHMRKNNLSAISMEHDALVRFTNLYHKKYPHGVPSIVLERVYKICARGLTQRDSTEIKKWSQNGLWDPLVRRPELSWKNIELQLANYPSAKMFKYALETIDPSQKIPMKKNLRGRKRMFTQKLDMTDDLESETPSQEFQLEQMEIQTKSTLEKIERTDMEEFDRFTQQLDMAPLEDSDSEIMQMLSDPSQQDLEGLERQDAEDH
jgi:hypothetical protein